MYKIHDFDRAFFYLATVAMITESMNFSASVATIVNGNKFFHHNYGAYQSKLSMKKWSEADKNY